MITLINIILVLLLVFMNSFFVATEFAMVKVRKSRIEILVIEGNNKAKHTLKIINDLNTYLSACQLGITLASLGLGWIGEPAVSKMVEPVFGLFHLSGEAVFSVSFCLGFIIITGFHIVLGELAPKSLAIINTEIIALNTSMPLIMFYKITYPIMWIFNHSTNGVLKIFGISRIEEQEAAHTDEEIKLLVEDSYRHGLIDKTELTFVDNIFDFAEKKAKEIMVPRTDMECIFMEDSIEDILKFVLYKHFTRYPVCRDNKDNVIGFVHIKDLYKKKIEGSTESIKDIIREIQFIPESMSISELLIILKKEKATMAIAVDEYGGTSGLVTVKDILEEIVGDINDEFDQENEEIIENKDGNYIVNAKIPIDDINELLKTNIESEDIDTIGGWIYSQLDTYPQINQKITYGDYEFIILKCDRKRISKVSINKLSK